LINGSEGISYDEFPALALFVGVTFNNAANPLITKSAKRSVFVRTCRGKRAQNILAPRDAVQSCAVQACGEESSERLGVPLH
jgi:hypothetical protein